MTGEKNRFATQEKLWKNQDIQLSTPKHDEMVLWLLNKKNIVSIIPEILRTINQFPLPQGFKRIYESPKNISEFWAYSGFQLSPTALEILQDTDIYTQVTFILPYISKQNDILTIEKDTLFTWFQYNLRRKIFEQIDVKSEVPILSGKFIIGYLDILVTNKTTYDQYAIEVKPKITSFGETLRQINTYKEYLKGVKFYILTTDTGFKNAFESQGIKVLEYVAK